MKYQRRYSLFTVSVFSCFLQMGCFEGKKETAASASQKPFVRVATTQNQNTNESYLECATNWIQEHPVATTLILSSMMILGHDVKNLAQGKGLDSTWSSKPFSVLAWFYSKATAKNNKKFEVIE